MNLDQISFNDMAGQPHTLQDYAGQVILIVNVASQCGLTPQYEGLERLYREKKQQGFEILAFPSNDFLAQEPGTHEEILEFCSLNYGVSFTLFEKIAVVGEKIHPLYRYLCQHYPTRIGEGPWYQDLVEYGLTPNEPPAILWNFEKFLIDRDGTIMGRFAPDITADDARLRQAIDAVLETEYKSDLD